MKIRTLLLALVVMLSFGLAACDFGVVDQGRVVAFDPATQMVTLVQDVNHDQHNPDYSGAVVSYKLPANPAEVGPLPKAGGRIKIDVDKKLVTLYNPAAKTLEKVAVDFTDVQKKIGANHPMVKGKSFPVIDKEKKTVTEYSKRQQILCTFTVPESMLSLPPEAWEAGDEVRIYYKNPNKTQALRFMNVSKTNIYKK